MRAFGGAITSSCSNDSECRRSTSLIFGLYPILVALLLVRCGVLQTHPKSTLWETASFILCFQMTCTVVISMQKTLASIVIWLVLTEARPPGQRRAQTREGRYRERSTRRGRASKGARNDGRVADCHADRRTPKCSRRGGKRT